MDWKERISALAGAAGVSGLTDALDAAEKMLAPLGEITRDGMGGLFCKIGTGARRILLDAHVDEIGLLVTAVDGNFLRVAKCGGVDPRTLVNQEVIVHGKRDLFGVFASIPPHLKKESDEAPKLEDMLIDCGYEHEELEKLVTPGDRVSFAATPVPMLNGRITGKSLDNRAGVAVLIDAASRLSDRDDVTLIVSLSAQEELGCRGAKTAAFAWDPEEAIVVDVSFGDGPDVNPRECGKVGGGVMIGVSPILNEQATQRLIQFAEEGGIPYQLEVMGGATGTNADPISVNRNGVPTVLLSIPLRNMHTACEVIDSADLQATSDLIVAYIEKGGADRA